MQVVAACTQSKRVAPGPATSMRTYVSGVTEADEQARIAERWRSAMGRPDGQVPLEALYKGGYWHAVSRVRRHARTGSRVHVMSAGAGLSAVDRRVQPYAATFNPRHDDSIPGAATREGRRTWWQLLGGDASLRALRGESGPVVFILPDSYLNVAGEDVCFLHDQLPPGQCIVFGSRPTRSLAKRLKAGWVQLDARMTRVLRCNVSALAPSALLYCLEGLGEGAVFTVEHARRRLATACAEDTPALYPKRVRRTPEQVSEWLVEELGGGDAPGSATAALRRFRAQGFAFEQKRFHRLFHASRGGSGGSTSEGES